MSVAEGAYKIIDEPAPSPLTKLSVNPVWIFLASLFAGTGVGLLWFLLNSFAIGSATKRREMLFVAIGIAGTPLIYTALGALWNAGFLDAAWAPYLRLGVTAFQLTMIYLLHLTQQRSFELFEFFGGTPRAAFIPLILLSVARPSLAEAMGPWSYLFL
jgi:hypothetical protein